MKLIAFEGPDCVGKTTQINELYATLRDKGYTASSHKIPYQYHLYSSAIIKEMISEELVNEFPLLFQAAMIENRKYFQREVLDKSTKDFVLVDRWNLSTLFYGEEQGIPSHISSELLRDIAEPSVYIIFDGAPFDRDSKDVLDRDLELQGRLRARYEAHEGKNVFHVSSNSSIKEVADRIWRLVQHALIPQYSCPSCNGNLEFKTKPENLIIKGKEISVETLAWWCDSCGEGVLNSRELQESQKQILGLC